MAKIIIDVLAKDLGNVLNSLTLNSEFADNVKYTLELDIIDSKNNFEALTKSDKVINWDFITEDQETIEDFSPKQSELNLKPNSLDDDPRALEIYAYFNHPEFFEDKKGLLKLIYLSWIIKQKSPSRLFTLCSLSSTKHLYSHTIKLDELAEYFPDTINERLIDYYKDMPFEAILEDTIHKLHKIWNKLSDIQEFSKVIDEFLKL